MITKHFWKDKKVLVTGHTGFKGSWLSLWLQSLKTNVVGFALKPPTIPNLFSEACVAEGMENVFADLRDYQSIADTIEHFQPEIVIHLAAQPLVRYSYQNPIETYATNVLGTVHLLEAIRHAGSVKAIVNVTTDKCYENKEWQWGYREVDRLGGYDPYSNSKACAELVTSAFRDSYYRERNIGLASVRAGNVIGGGDWAVDRLIPDIIRAQRKNVGLSIRNPNARRPWQHVMDPLHGYLMLAEKLYETPDNYSESWNFGPNEEDIQSVDFIIKQLTNHLPGKLKWSLADNQQLHEASILKLDCAKAKSRLAWYPRWRLKNALKLTADWYLAYESGQNMREYTLAQIEEFNFVTEEQHDDSVYACTVR